MDANTLVQEGAVEDTPVGVLIFGKNLKLDMEAVAVNLFQNFLWSNFLTIRQNVNMATCV